MRRLLSVAARWVTGLWRWLPDCDHPELLGDEKGPARDIRPGTT